MINRVRVVFFLLALPAFLSFLGCGSDSAGLSSNERTAISGQVSVPANLAAGLTANIVYEKDSTLIEKLKTSGTCTVNGQLVPFSLLTDSNHFEIGDLDPAPVYDIVFSYGAFFLRARIPHTSAVLTQNLDLDSTAEAYLLEKFQVSSEKMKTQRLKDSVQEALASKLLLWLRTVGMDGETLQAQLTQELATLLATSSWETISDDLTPQVDGIWKAKSVTFYTLNAVGEPAYKAVANITLNLVQKDSAFTGNLDIEILEFTATSVTTSGQPPIDETRTISGFIQDGTLVYEKIAVTGPNKGNSDEKWELKISAGTLKGTITNRDPYFSGLNSKLDALVFTR